MGLFLGILNALLGIFILGQLIYTGYQNKKNFRSLDSPIRTITDAESCYLAIYLQKYHLTLSPEHQNKVYLIEGGELRIDTIIVPKGDSLKRYTLDNKWIYFPYRMLQYTSNITNTVEAIIVKGNFPYSSTGYYAFPVSVNGHSLISHARSYWQSQGRDNANIISQRLETALEYDIRQSSLYYIKEAIYLSVTLLLLILASWCVGVFYYIYLGLALVCAWLTFRQFFITYTQHKEPQAVLTVKGRLAHVTFAHIDTLVDSKPEPCLGPHYYLHVPDYIKQASNNIFDHSNDVTEYCADITAHKSSGYTLLHAQDLPPIDKLIDTNYSTTFVRGFIFFVILMITWIFVSSTDHSRTFISNISALLSDHFVTHTTYTSSKQLFDNSPKQGDFVQLINSKPLACRVGTRYNERPSECKSFYLNPPPSAMTLPTPPDYIMQMINEDYPHQTELVEDGRWSAAISSTIIHQPLFIKNIEKSCRFDATFDCSVVYKALADSLVSMNTVTDYVGNTVVSENTNDYKGEVTKILDRPTVHLMDSGHTAVKRILADWAANSLTNYWGNEYVHMEKQYMTSNIPKIIIEIDSFDVFETGSFKFELNKTTNDDRLYYLTSWFDVIAIRDKNPRHFTLSGRVLASNQKEGLLSLNIVTRSGYKEANKHRKQGIAILLALLFSVLAFVIVCFSCFYKPAIRKRLLP